MNKKDILKQLETTNDAHKKQKHVIRIGEKHAQEIEGPHPVFVEEGELEEKLQVKGESQEKLQVKGESTIKPSKYIVDSRMGFFDRSLALDRIQKMMKGEEVANLNQQRIKSAPADSHSLWSMTNKDFNAAPEGRIEIFSGLDKNRLYAELVGKKNIKASEEDIKAPIEEVKLPEEIVLQKDAKIQEEDEPKKVIEEEDSPKVPGEAKEEKEKEEKKEVKIPEEEKVPGEKKKRVSKRQPKEVIAADIPRGQLVITDKVVSDRVPKRKSYVRKISPYYMYNRRIFVQKLGPLFKSHADEIAAVVDEDVSCDNRTSKNFDLLTHQKVVTDYLNTYTPYRGLLIYHGLGSGKTCTSIAIAEGMKTDKEIVVMTPASLKVNFFSELKKCGDDIYRRKQHWVKQLAKTQSEADIIGRALALDPDVIQRKGVWLMNTKLESNFDTLSSAEQAEIDQQLDQMIRAKYQDINYNGMNGNIMKRISKEYTINPFDNKVVIIDEAHNFISRIMNKLKDPDSISYRLYEYLMGATNAKVVFLSGTPIINYPNEIGIMFNMLHGYIKTWKFPITVKTESKTDKESIMRLFRKERITTYDYLEYSGSELTITRNPYGFVNVQKRTAKEGDDEMTAYGGIQLDPAGNVSDAEFEKRVIEVLGRAGLEVSRKGISIVNHKSLPDDTETFLKMFVDPETGNLNNADLLKRRILGLTSYFRSAQEQLLPKYEKATDFQEIRVEMSDYQLMKYSEVRNQERERDKKKNQKNRAKVGEDTFQVSSSYRIFSRELCNFVFPEMVERPGMLKKADFAALFGKLDAMMGKEKESEFETRVAAAEETADSEKAAEALAKLMENGDAVLSKEGLAKYSPKFLNILENIEDPENVGLHLLYSQFRTLEGIGILKVILEYHGFQELKMVKTAAGEWDIGSLEPGKQRFLLYTGTETPEEKEILRHIYNSNWDQISPSLRERLELISPNNYLGEIVKVFMITASGAEGINLENTRFVHITEPYWHATRLEQVIGRARRICSHKNLPEELRTIHVFMYLSVMSDAQKNSRDNLLLMTQDLSRLDNETPITTDEYLYEISNVKESVNRQILMAVKETAVDCSLYKNTENLVCYGAQVVRSNEFASVPELMNDSSQKTDLNFKTKKKKLVEATVAGTKYLYNNETGELYDQATLKPVGKKVVVENGKVRIVAI
jgi:hypothetical protein